MKPLKKWFSLRSHIAPQLRGTINNTVGVLYIPGLFLSRLSSVFLGRLVTNKVYKIKQSSDKTNLAFVHFKNVSRLFLRLAVRVWWVRRVTWVEFNRKETLGRKHRKETLDS